MAARQAKVNLEINQAGNAKQSLKETSQLAKELGSTIDQTNRKVAQSEEQYQSLLKQTIALMEQRKRLEQDVQNHVKQSQVIQNKPGVPLGKGGLPGKGGLLGQGGAAITKAGGPLAVATAAIAGLTTVFEGVGKTADVMGNSSLTAAQKNEKLAESLPIVGGLAKAWREMTEALDGTTDKLRQNAVQREKDTASIAAETSARQKAFSARMQASQAQGQAAGLNGVRLASRGPTDRSTYQGEISYQEDNQRLAALDKVATAEGKVAGAKRHAVTAATEEKKLQGDLASLTRQQADLEKKRTDLRSGGRNKADIDSNETQINKVNEQISARMNELEAARNTKKEAGLALAQQEQELNQARIEQMQTELQILQQKEQRLSAQSKTLADMTQAERQRAVRVAEKFKEKGYAGLTRSERETLGRVNPGLADKEKQKFGEGLAENKKLQDLGGFEKGSVSDVQQQQTALVDQIRQATLDSQKSYANATAKIFQEFADKMVQAIDAAVSLAVKKITNKRAITNNLS